MKITEQKQLDYLMQILAALTANPKTYNHNVAYQDLIENAESVMNFACENWEIETQD